MALTTTSTASRRQQYPHGDDLAGEPMSTPPTGSPASQAQQPYYLCPCCDTRWSLRDVRYCCACRDCGSGLIAIPEDQSVVMPNG
jgi:hypothetical protein